MKNQVMQKASRYIAVCDVLGFKSMLEMLTLDDLSIRYLNLLAMVKRMARDFSNISPFSDDIANLVSHAVFSDTLLIWSEPLDPKGDLIDIGPVSMFFDICNLLIPSSIIMNMPLRIGVAFGEVCLNPPIGLFIGRPIADAYVLEQKQQWVGGACHSSCLRAPYFDRIQSEWRDVINCRVPIDEGYMVIPALNWPHWGNDECVAYIVDRASNEKDHRVKRKYKEAAVFFRKARKRTGLRQRNSTTRS